MAGRPPKMGLDYSAWDVDVFTDRDIIRLMDAQGCSGFVVFFFLCQMAYRDNGYYYHWRDDDAAIIAKMIGGGLRARTVQETVASCLRLGLFDKGLFDRNGILTSHRLQQQYLHAARKRSDCAIRDEYALPSGDFQKTGEGGRDSYTLAPDLSPKNTNFTPINSAEIAISSPEIAISEQYRIEKDIIKQNSILQESAYSPPPRPPWAPTWEELKAFGMARGWGERDCRRFFDCYEASRWLDSKGYQVRKWKQKMIWWEKDAEERRRPVARQTPPPPDPAEQSARVETMRRMAEAMKNHRPAGNGGNSGGGNGDGGNGGGGNGGSETCGGEPRQGKPARR